MEVMTRRQNLIVIVSLMVLVSRSRAAIASGSGQHPPQDIKPRQGTVSDFLGQLGALALQGNLPNGAAGGYLQAALQQYYQNRPPYSSYAQYNLQNLHYQHNTGGGFGLRPDVPVPVRPGLNPGNAPYPQFYQGFRPPLAPSPSLTGALQSVARYDDARCVPRLLCEVTAGGTPGSSREAALPFVNRDTLLSLLTVLNFGNDSPLLVFGRAALLGYMAQGDPATCLSAYPTCPRDPDLLVDYLNNHNGGFFRFFSSVNQQQQQGQYYAPHLRDNNHLHNIQSRILTALHPNETPDSLTTGNVGSATRAGTKYNFKFPAKKQTSLKFGAEEESRTEPPPGDFFQDEAIDQQLVEASANGELPTFTLEDGEYTFVNPYSQTSNKNGDVVKTFTFPTIRVGSPAELAHIDNRPPPYVPLFQQKPVTPMTFPDKTGTGDLRLDFDLSFLSPSGNPYGNPAPPVYSASTSNFRDQNTRGGRFRFPKDDRSRRVT